MVKVEPLISVVICTFNRAEVLRDAIISACDQRIAGDLYEILIVDNNSTDDTPSMVEELQRENPRIRYCVELVQGLSAARNRGYREAAGEYVAYLDDDAKAPEKWLSTAMEIIETQNPDVFGGPYYPYYRTKKPEWYLDRFGSYEMADGPQMYTSNDLYLSGGNIFIRKELLARMNGFRLGLGMSGGQVAYGEETDFLNRLRAEIPEVRIYYDPALYILHLVRAQKMTFKWRIKELYQRGGFSLKTRNIFSDKGYSFILRYLMANIYYFLYNFIVGVWRRDRCDYPLARSFIYDIGLRPVAGIGRVVTWFQLRRGENK